MYIYQLPFEINKELCRLLDHDDDWKELAGVHMKYSAFDVNEIEQESKRQSMSPSNHLLVRWGQLNHLVQELFILLHHMKHVPAMRCLASVVDERFHRLLKKHSTGERETVALDEKSNNQRHQKESDSSLPLPVMLIEKGVQLPSSSKVDQLPTDNRSESGDNTSSTNGSKQSVTDEDLLRSVSAIPVLSYEELRRGTGGWSEDHVLGRGGFGKVYKGVWKLLPVAVKRLRDNGGKNKELIAEMCLNQYRHDNILPLYGYSLGGPEACLVYQLMAGGSLEQRLHGKTHHPPLDWGQRYRIAHGVASGLQYLHTLQRAALVHGDIKPANVLLDACCAPKIGDFGLARKAAHGEDRSHLKVSKVHGTRAYLPEDYLRSRCLSAAVDVFSYGVLLLELGSARAAARGERLLSDHVRDLAAAGADLASLEDPALQQSGSDPALCRALLALGARCSRAARAQRPAMLDVRRRLDALPAAHKYRDLL